MPEFCALWVHGTDVETLASELSLDLSTRTPCYLSEILDRQIEDGSRWVAEVDGWIGVVPAPSGEDGYLRSLTAGGRQAITIDMDINGNCRLKYARDGHLLVAVDPVWPDDDRYGDEPHALDHLMAGLRFGEVEGDCVDVDGSISSALALIGRITGTDMAADWSRARHFSLKPCAS